MNTTPQANGTEIDALLVQAATLPERTIAASQAVAERHGVTLPDLTGGYGLGLLTTALGNAITKLRYAKDGDGTIPADLTAASLAAFNAAEAKTFASAVRYAVKKDNADRITENLPNLRDRIAKAEAALAQIPA